MISTVSTLLWKKHPSGISLRYFMNTKFINAYDLTKPFPTQAEIVIAGAGVVANSVAYHLIKNGKTDIIVIDQGKVGSGTSHFGSGVLGLFKPVTERNFIRYSIKLYQKIQEMGYDIELRQCGSMNLAQTKDRLIALKRRMAYNIPTGLDCKFLNTEQIKDYHPYLRTDDLEGAVWVPADGVANPKAICNVLALLAQEGGVRYIEDTTVRQVLTNNSSVYAVETDRGTIKCKYFVNCCGMWARELGLQCEPPVRIPAYPAQHFFATTGYINEDIDDSLPIVRDYDAFTYIRAYQSGFMAGWFEEQAKPAFTSQVPKNWQDQIENDYNHIWPLWEKAVDRMPSLADCSAPNIVNSPDNFTPDGRWIIGEASQINNYFVACGMNGNPLQGAGGIGRAVAEWIVQGEPTQDILPFHVQRFLDIHNSRPYLQRRVKEVVGRHYALLYPLQSEYKQARKLRCSPLYSVLETKGAVFGIKMAYERALYFDTTYTKGCASSLSSPTFFKPKFFDFMREEYLACREGVGIIDMSSFSKIQIKSTGQEVVNYLQHLCSNDIDVPIGFIVHTGMQNDRGCYENDCMLVRQAENCYFMISPTSQQTRIFNWLTRHLSPNTSIVLNDLTSMYTVINVVGPKATGLLNELSNSNMKMPAFYYKKVNIGYASDVMVMSFTHTGEPGYCLYIPSEYALHVYYRLMLVGRDFGVRDIGVLTQRFMRIERFIPFWADELNSRTTPFEAGNSYSVRLDKKDFIGKQALIKQRERGLTKQLLYFHLININPDDDIWPWGGEPIYRNDEYVGTVTSAGYGFYSDKLICLGFIKQPASSSHKIVTTDYLISKDCLYEIDIAGSRVLAMPHIYPPAISVSALQTKQYRPTVVSSYKSDISR